MRYAGQNYERDVRARRRAGRRGALAAAFDAFHELHHEVYGYSFPGETIELIHANVTALGPGARPAPARARRGQRCRSRARCATCASRRPRARRRPSSGATTLPAGAGSQGPAIVEELDSTTLVLPGQELRVLADGILPLSRRRAPGSRRRERRQRDA